MWTTARSPGRPPITKTALPSTWATPRPSCERSVMSTSWVCMRSQLLLVPARIDTSTRDERYTVPARRRPALTLCDGGAILPALPLLRSRIAVPNILVADDNPVSLAFFADALAALGMSSELACDGVETVERAMRTQFDLLLL